MPSNRRGPASCGGWYVDKPLDDPEDLAAALGISTALAERALRAGHTSPTAARKFLDLDQRPRRSPQVAAPNARHAAPAAAAPARKEPTVPRSTTSTSDREAKRRAEEDVAQLRRKLGREPSAADIMEAAAARMRDREQKTAATSGSAQRERELADLDAKMGIRPRATVRNDGTRLVTEVMTPAQARAYQAQRDADAELEAHRQRYGGSR